MNNSTGNAPLLRLAQSPEHMQAVLLHADVAPWAFEEGAEPLDLREVWSDVVALESDHGGFIFHNLQDGIYEVHTAFLPCEREAFPRACESVRLMFTYTDCQTVLTKVPEDNTRAWKLAEKVGFGLEYVRPQAYRRNGQLSIGVLEASTHEQLQRRRLWRSSFMTCSATLSVQRQQGGGRQNCSHGSVPLVANFGPT